MYKNNFSLIESLKKGEDSAYAYLLKQYHKRLFTYLYTLTHDDALAEDIIQNVFLNLWEYRSRLKPEYSIQNFLYRSCYNEFVNYYKKNQRRTDFEKGYIQTVKSLIESTDINLLERKNELIFEGVSSLPDKCAEVFMLSKKEGLTNNEIAEYLNLSLKTVEGHLTKAYTTLRELLGAKLMSFFFFLVK